MITKLQLHDQENNLISYLQIEDFNSFEGVDSVDFENTISIVASNSHPQFTELSKKYNKILFYDTGNAQWQEYIITEVSIDLSEIYVYAEHSIFEMNSCFIDFSDLTGRTVINGINELIESAEPQTNWIAGTSDIIGNFYMQRSKTTLMQSLLDWGIKVGGELSPRIEISGSTITRYIDIVSQRGSDRGKVIYDDREMETFNQKISAEDVFTAAYGYGQIIDEVALSFEDVEWSILNGDPVDKPVGQKYITLSDDLQEEFGLYSNNVYQHRFTHFTDTQISDPNELITKTYDMLTANILNKIGYSITAFDLKALGFDSEEIRVGDTVGLVVSILGLKLKTRVIKIAKNYHDGTKNKFEFGTPKKTIADSLVSTLSVARNAEKKAIENHIQSVLDQWNAEIAAGTSYMKADPTGGLSFFNDIDEEAATEALNLRAGAWRIANSKTAGEWNYRTVATGSGIAAGEVNTGVMHGQNMDIDLDTGIIYFGERVNGVIENPVMQYSVDGFQIIGDTMDANHTSEVMEYIAKNGNIIAYFAANGAYIPTLIVDTQIKLSKTRFQPMTMEISGQTYQGFSVTIND